MPSGASVTQLIDRLKAGDREAVQCLWERYFGELVRRTRRWLRHKTRPVADEEDVALSAFDSVCRRAEQGRFPRLFDRDDLWQLLVVIAYRKSCNEIKREIRRQPRGGRVFRFSELADGAGDESALFAEMLSREPSPEMAAQTAEECRRLLDGLGDETLRRVALWKLEGYTNEEIAPLLGRKRATVERKLKKIRLRWEKEVGP
jgi:DNA-directed RNA polymerase specialized sigma24 family protein